MATHFTDNEWSLIKAAPHWVFAALSAADGRVGAITASKEKVAMGKVLEEAASGNELVDAAVDAGDDKHDIKNNASLADALAQLKKVNALLEAKVGRDEGEEFRDFLMDVGNDVAAAAKEGLLNTKVAVSDEEKAALQDIADALEATAAHKNRRLAAEKREERAEARQAAAATAAAAKKAAAARAKTEAAARSKADSAHQKRVQAARVRKAAADKKAAEEAKARDAARAAAKKKVEAARAKQASNVARAKAAAATEARQAAAAAAEAAKPLATHTVGGGDSLSAIAAHYYGSGVRANWMKIYEANKDIIGKNPGLIIPGQVLEIPKL